MSACSVCSAWIGRSVTASLVAIGAAIVLTTSPPTQVSSSSDVGVILSQRRFEPNVGQTDPDVRYLVRGAGPATFLTRDSIVMSIADTDKQVRSDLEIQLVGSNPDAESTGLEETPMTSNYAVGHAENHRRGIPSFRKVRFDEVYPGIDLVYYGAPGRKAQLVKDLEYDFVVEPGADPSLIRLSVAGADAVEIEDGELRIIAEAGEIRQQRPAVYQEIAGIRKPVGGRFVLDAEGMIGFDLDHYDPRESLVIDPVIEYSQYFGGSGDDRPQAIDVDDQGNLFGAGFTRSMDFPKTRGSSPSKGTVFQNGFIFAARVDGIDTGPLTTCIAEVGTSGMDLIQDAKAFPGGRGLAAFTGFTDGEDFPVTNGPDDANSFDMVVGVFDTNCDLRYAELIGDEDGQDGLAVDVACHASNQCNILGIGRTRNGSGFFDPGTQDFQGGEFDAVGFQVLLNLSNRDVNPLGISARDLGGGLGQGVVIHNRPDGTSDAIFSFVTDPADQQDDPTEGETDVVVQAFEFNPANLGDWVPVSRQSVGTSGVNDAWDVHYDAAADRLAVVLTDSSPDAFDNFPNTFGPGGGFDSGVASGSLHEKGEGGALELSYAFGSSGPDQVIGAIIDRNGCDVITGLTLGNDFPLTPDALVTEPVGSFAGFIIRVCDDGTRLDYSSYLSFTGSDSSIDVAEDQFGQLWTITQSLEGWPTTSKFLQPDFPGGVSGVLNRYRQPYVSRAGVVNSAKFAQPEGGGISPQEVLTEFGVLVGPAAGVGLTLDSNGNVLTEIGGTRALVNGQPMPMVSASRLQSSFIAPADLTAALLPKGAEGGAATLQFELDGDLSNTVTLPVVEANPGLFSLNSTGSGQGAILNPDFSVNGPENPSDFFIVVYGTGGGTVDPPCPDGTLAPAAEPLPRLTLPHRVLVDGVEANTIYAGSAPNLVCGVNQYNVLPTNSPSGPAVEIQACVADVCSNIVTAAFE